ncbi:serine hydrolase [Mycolicibacterium fallax]|uniref:hypothetical protein n=1 Tax=Mycolicibacterium fallax TaxID=1793 RepID=UPI00138BE3ED|nr:hypothetical protein [Mycolicibacterium fallax]BBY97915.1 hypothetical protein MFAL_13820 [Mycolicibacterium fallax]
MTWSAPLVVTLAIVTVCALGICAYFFVLSPRLTSAPQVAETAPVTPPVPAETVLLGVSAVPQAPTPAPVTPTGFEALEAELAAQIGVAFAPVGRAGESTAMGAWSSGPAWSTIKVPLSIALLRQDGERGVTANMRAAITQSDNAAAQAIWDELGAHQAAADKVGAVLAGAGEPVSVQPEVTRPGFSAFGQTQWSLESQARFLANSACTPGDQPVLALMGEISSGQAWGLGTIDGARFKGGWGPGTDGLYLVRQYGLISGPNGDVAVAIAAIPNSGGFGDGTAVLNRIADWLAEQLERLPGGRCESAG